MKIYKAIYSRGVRYILATSQEEAVALSPSFSERYGILETVFALEE